MKNNINIKRISFLHFCAIVFFPVLVSADIASVTSVNNRIRSVSEYSLIDSENIASNTYLLNTIGKINNQYGCVSFDFVDRIQSRVLGESFLKESLPQNIIKNCDQYYEKSGLIMNLDLGVPLSVYNRKIYDLSGTNDVDIYASVGITDKSVALNAAGSYMRTANPVNLSSYEYITVEVRFRTLTVKAQGPIFEFSQNWNAEFGGFGIFANTNFSPYAPNYVHGNHNGSAVFSISNVTQTDLKQHTISWVLSSNNLLNNHIVYYDGVSIGVFSGDRPFGNDYIWFGQRGLVVSASAVPNLEYFAIRIYNRALTAAEVCSNAWKDYNRFGGFVPKCAM